MDANARLAHMANDYEILRTRSLRLLSAQVDLLTDGLHALQHDSADVTEEYLERTIAALTAEVARLRADKPSG